MAYQRFWKVAQRYRRRYRRQLRWVGVSAGGAVLVALATWGWLQTQGPVRPRLAATVGVSVSGHLQMRFGQELAGQPRAQLQPVAAGVWQPTRGLLGLTGLTFVPTAPLLADQTYTVRLSGLRRLATGAPVPAQTLRFVTEAPPAVAGFSLAPGAVNVPVRPNFTLRLGAANHGLIKPKLSLEPAVPFTAVASNDTSFSWQPAADLTQGTTYRVMVDDTSPSARPNHRRLIDQTFRTVAEPTISNATTGGYFYPGSTITVAFAQDMRPDPAPLSFAMPGSGSWTNAATYVFKPNGLSPGASYSYRLVKGALSAAGGVVMADQTFQISTPGHVVVADHSPGGSGVGLNATVRFSFDQPVDHASAESHFAISPAVPGGFSWSGNMLVFTPNQNYDYQTTYTASLAAGVASVYGLPTTQVYTTQFTTALQTIYLNVPTYRQAYALSCESAALRMALAYRGVAVSDFDVLQRLNYNPRPRDTAGNNWDNPYTMFVGDVTGVQNSTGYGVYAGPIAAAAQSFGRPASAYSSISASFISARLHSGEPVIIWGYNTVARPDSWNTPDGVVQAWVGEHTRVVAGVVGSVDAPAGFYVNDPATGGQYYWTTSQLLANLNVLGGLSNQAVVVD
ncbi:MAG TPA: Ig-like domain-containing protein [Candidatus Saccharimonadia bacterium]|nr:Ig-like domain-containing protein [Candidatus Saccharimonadia bacterium]